MMSNEKVKRIFDKSKDLVNNNEKIKSLLNTAKEKLQQVQDHPKHHNAFVRQIMLVVRMIQAHFNGTYHGFSTRSMLMLVFSLVYFITPVDLIPDFIPALGFTDDISVLYLVFRNLSDDIEGYKAWEESQA